MCGARTGGVLFRNTESGETGLRTTDHAPLTARAPAERSAVKAIACRAGGCAGDGHAAAVPVRGWRKARIELDVGHAAERRTETLTSVGPQPSMLSWFHRSTHVRSAWADDAAGSVSVARVAEPRASLKTTTRPIARPRAERVQRPTTGSYAPLERLRACCAASD